MGTCVYHVGWQTADYPNFMGLSAQQQTPFPTGRPQWQTDGGWTELATPTEAWNEARTLALGRLRDEARAAGALAVVDVAYRRVDYDWAQGAIEIVATGTAVGSDRFVLDETEEIPLTNLSGEDVWKLLESGWWPLGIVAGSTVLYVVSSYRTSRSLRLLDRHRLPEPGARGLHERPLRSPRPRVAPRPPRCERRGSNRRHRAQPRTSLSGAGSRSQRQGRRSDHHAPCSRHGRRRRRPRRAAADLLLAGNALRRLT